jgi:hypothetical protein
MKLNAIYFSILIGFSLFIFSGCSPFGNSSLIETFSSTISVIFENKPTPAQISTSGGQIVSNVDGYRMNVGVANSSSRAKTTCNGEGYCIELAISR